MSGVKHTPVELHAVFNGLYWDVAVGPHDYSQRVASCHANHVLGHSLADAERHARIFAAAPDLLGAGAELQAARKAQKLSPSAENLSRVRIASDAFDAAIARARGEQDGGGE